MTIVHNDKKLLSKEVIKLHVLTVIKNGNKIFLDVKVKKIWDYSTGIITTEIFYDDQGFDKEEKILIDKLVQ